MSPSGVKDNFFICTPYCLRGKNNCLLDSNYLLLGDACSLLEDNNPSGADKWLITISLAYMSLLDTDKALLCAYYNFLYSNDFL